MAITGDLIENWLEAEHAYDLCAAKMNAVIYWYKKSIGD